MALVAAIGVTAQEIPAAQQRSPATYEQYPYRPACRQLTAAPGSAAGWLAWGPTVEGTHQNWKGLQSSVAPEDAYQRLADIGLCVVDGELVPFEQIGVGAISAESKTRGRRNVAELKARLDNPESEPGETSTMQFLFWLAGIWGAVCLFEKFEDRPLMRKLTGNTDTFAFTPPDLERPTAEIPSRVSPEILDAASAERDQRSAYQTLLASPFVSRAIFGGQRTGKTNLAAQAARKLSETRQIKFFHFNLNSVAGSDEDANYFDVDGIRSVRGDLLHASPEEAKRLINEVNELMDEFMTYTQPSILIADEWSELAASFNEHVDLLAPLIASLAAKISGFASSGMKRRKAIWTIAPVMVAGQLEKFGLAVKSLSPILVAIAPGHTAKWEDEELSFDRSLYGQVSKNYPGIEEPPTDSAASRIAFINGRWAALGTRSMATVPVQPSGFAADAATIAALPTTEDDLSEDLQLFRDWLTAKLGEVVEYRDFNNASKFKSISRSRESFDFLCDKACIKGWLSPRGDDGYLVIK
ncbi:MAG: hypothetical protein DCF25_15570 [Leptolyngbya foveolarum]|uniref:Uncharacterized protein n=1 Tax=Leptolyngbya foveolarum TaxID=47253 RepID=A0A2W4U9T0_9CYAN|nr:MAG: hypothetical protein DCF25_15570 [Leptolyngbya foveolarum]